MEDPSGNNPPWCFYPAGQGGGPEVCEAINFVGDAGPGFSQADFDNMKDRFVVYQCCQMAKFDTSHLPQSKERKRSNFAV